jgi:hypothetical protein
MPVFDFSVFEYVGAAYVNNMLCDHWRETIRGSVDFYDSDDVHIPVRVQGSSPQGGTETTDWWQVCIHGIALHGFSNPCLTRLGAVHHWPPGSHPVLHRACMEVRQL